MTAYYSPLTPPVSKEYGNTTWNRSRAAWIIIHFVLRELTYASVFVHLQLLHPPTCATPCPRGLWTTPAWWTPRFYLRNRFTWPASDNNRPGIPLIYSVFTPPIPFHLTLFSWGGRGCCEGDRYRCALLLRNSPLMLVDGILGDGIHSFIVMWFGFPICFKVVSHRARSVFTLSIV